MHTPVASISLRRLLFITVSSLLIETSWFAVESQAVTLFETATLGTTGRSGTWAVDSDAFLGVRFQVTSTFTAMTIGGHFDRASLTGNNLFFGAIVALTSNTDFPNSTNLSTPDVLGTALLKFPEPSDEAWAPITVTLNPGNYALVFGSGLFGATGTGGVPVGNNLIGTPPWLSYSSNNWQNTDLAGGASVRFFIKGEFGSGGDYNGNGVVDAADYVVWRKSFGKLVAPGTGADGNGNGEITSLDYSFWRERFAKAPGSGSTFLSLSSFAQPEPSTTALLLFATLGLAMMDSRRCNCRCA